MALKKLSTAEMVKHSADLLREGGDERSAIEAVPLTAPLLPELQKAHDGLLAGQAPSSSKLAKLTEEAGALDDVHDEKVRGIYGRFESELSLATDGATRERLVKARDAVLPTGTAVVQRSYVEEAGEGQLREARLTPDVRKVLAKLKDYSGSTMEQHVDTLEQTCLRLGEVEKQRAALGAQGPGAARIAQARNQWIRAVNALASNLALAGVDEEPILGRVREAEAKAERRGAGSSAPAATGDEPDQGKEPAPT